jgi:penicillin G amidase
MAPFVCAISALVGVTIVVGGSLRLGEVPALGPLLSPFEGFWRNMPHSTHVFESRDVTLKGADGDVTIVKDDRGVPHIFAKSDRDLAWGQGYSTARDRLWQMDFQARSAAGRLAEVLGPKLVGRDATKRNRGMVWAAERMIEEVRKTPESYAELEAYSAGVNAYVQTLTPAHLPIEYKLLGSTPEPWSPLRSALFIKEMAHDLTGGSEDIRMTNTRAALGDSQMAALFPGANASV